MNELIGAVLCIMCTTKQVLVNMVLERTQHRAEVIVIERAFPLGEPSVTDRLKTSRLQQRPAVDDGSVVSTERKWLQLCALLVAVPHEITSTTRVGIELGMGEASGWG